MKSKYSLSQTKSGLPDGNGHQLSAGPNIAECSPTTTQAGSLDAQLYRLLIRDLSNPAIFLVDLTGKIISWNAGVQYILGYREAEFVGRNYDFLFPEEERLKGIPEHRIDAAVENGSRSCISRHRRNNGTYIDTSCVFTLVRDNLHGPLGVVVLLQETIADKRSDDPRVIVTESLLQSNEDLTRFAHIVAHDLRAPLRMVGSYVQLLRKELDGQLGGRSHECMRHVLQGINHMDSLITSLLGYAQADNAQLGSVAVNLEDVLEDTLTILELAVRETAAEVTHDRLPSVQGDPVLLLEVLQNLIANALKYRADEPLRIHISAQETGAQWTISVRDNGIGIDSQYSEKIFLPLARLHGPQISGSGIGLAVCKRVIERHGGRIWVESAAGSGCTFFFSLPKLPVLIEN